MKKQKRKYIETNEIVSLTTTIDGVSTFVDAFVMCDDGVFVSLNYYHPIYGNKITKVVSRLDVLPRIQTEGKFYAM